MKEKITDEYGKFETIAKGLNNQLCTLLLTDIMASLVNVYKNDEGEIVKDYNEFDTLVTNIKELLEIDSIKGEIVLIVDGYKDEVTVYAVNRVMAFMLFEDFGYEDVITVDCFRVLDEEE